MSSGSAACRSPARQLARAACRCCPAARAPNKATPPPRPARPPRPRPGETVGSGVLSVLPGGKGANQAHAAARLGAATVLVAAVGTDQAAADERAALAADGADTSELVICEGPSGTAVILVDQAGENMIAV